LNPPPIALLHRFPGIGGLTGNRCPAREYSRQAFGINESHPQPGTRLIISFPDQQMHNIYINNILHIVNKLSFGAESFAFELAIKKLKDIQKS